MAESFEALGRDVESALDHDDTRVAALLAERDSLLAQLTSALVATGANEARSDDMVSVSAALESASASTATLIARVAERTDALRSALRDVSRGASATRAYQAAPGTSEYVNARR